MTKSEICGLILAIFLGGGIFIAVIGCAICSIIQETSHRKYKKKYEKIEQMKKQKSVMSGEYCKFWNTKILPLHNKIDSLEKDMKYIPVKEQDKYLNEIEEIRQKSFELEKELELSRVIEDNLLKDIQSAILNTNDKKYIKYNKNLNWLEKENVWVSVGIVEKK